MSEAISLPAVRAFLAVVDQGSVSAAAKVLALAQPTVSQQLTRLETAVGARLLQRGRGAAALTPTGRELLPHARAMIASAARMTAPVARTLTIGASGNVSSFLLAEGLKAFDTATGRGIPWTVRTAANPSLADALDAGEIDVAVMEWALEQKGLSVRLWRREPLVLVVPPDHPLSQRRAVPAADLSGFDFVGGEPGTGTGRLLTAALGEVASAIKVTVMVGSTEGVKSAVKAGLGVSIVLEAAVRAEVAAGLLVARPIEGVPLVKPHYIAHRAELPPSAPAMRFADALLASTPAASGVNQGLRPG